MMLPSQQAQAWNGKTYGRRKISRPREPLPTKTHQPQQFYLNASEWAGAANYRAENYEAAIAAFSTSDTADGHYNRGNALALSGNYAEAIAAYDMTLSLNDTHADAIQNKAIVEQLLEQEESESGENQEGEDQDSESEQNSENESEQDSENSEQQDQESQEGNQDQQMNSNRISP